jgi:hypothetical protein
LTGPEPLTYPNYIFTDFDNRRITYCGKKSPVRWLSFFS